MQVKMKLMQRCLDSMRVCRRSYMNSVNQIKRNLDGIYFRVKRDEKWDNVCFSDMTQDEMENVMNNRDIDWLKSMCVQLGRTIRDIGDQLDIVCE